MSIMIQNSNSIANIYNNIKSFENKLYLDYHIEDIKTYLEILHLINVEAYNTRYKENAFEPAINWNYKEIPSKYQLLQSLYFLDYQIELEYVNITEDKKEALQFLEDVIFATQKMIIQDLPEFGNTEWK